MSLPLKKFFFLIFSLAIFAVILITPHFVLAAANGFSIFDESQNCQLIKAATATTEAQYVCTLCNLLALIQKLVNYALLYLLVPIAAIFVVYGGFLVMTAGASPSNIQKGRTAILTAAIGVAIAFGSWIIVNEVMSFLAGSYFSVTPWHEIKCESGAQPATTETPTPTATVQEPTKPPPSALKCSADKNSPQLDAVINCIKSAANARGLALTGQITTYQGGHTCKPPPPATPTNISCHYGGLYCNGTAHAADFPLIPSQRNPANWTKLRDIGNACQTSASRCEKGSDPYITTCNDPLVDHIHINDSVSCGCN